MGFHTGDLFILLLNPKPSLLGLVSSVYLMCVVSNQKSKSEEQAQQKLILLICSFRFQTAVVERGLKKTGL